MLLNAQATQYKLSALPVDHKTAGYEDVVKPYSIFNTSLNDYYVILDSNSKFEPDELFRVIAKFIKSQTRHEFTIDGDSFLSLVAKDEATVEAMVTALVSSINYGSVTPWSMKKADIEAKKLEHNLVLSNNVDFAKEMMVVAEAQTVARRLQDMPSNIMRPGDFEIEVRNLFNGLNVEIEVLDEKQLSEKGMNMMLSVGLGATQPFDKSRMMVIKYMGNPETTNKYAFVGKGVCFDTGGYSLKPAAHMRWMKYDMSGAAIMAATVYALAKNNVKTNAIAVMPLVLNLIGNLAQRPDDVRVAYNGKTVEIDNTDAEGRLILGDAITYAAKDLDATKIFDAATLTGAMIYCLGDTFTGVWTTDDQTWMEIVKATRTSGELIWRLPFHHDFLDLLDSNFADIANSVSDIRGGSSRAASFLKFFAEGKTLSHFDIAGTADKSHYGQAGHRGTGVMVKTFYNIAKNAK